MSDSPFGRQPKLTTVTIEGEPIDVRYWLRELAIAAESNGDNVMIITPNSFKIYPKAVND